MQLETIILYHVDGVRSHAVDFWLGRLNVITGASETGKSALIEIVDYCLGSDRHGVYRSKELGTIGWYGLMLRIDDRPVFVARRAPGSGQKTSTDAMLIEGRDTPPTSSEIQQTTNAASVTARLGELLGIEETETDVPDGSTRKPIRASLRHALAYAFQRQRLIADPEYLFAGQDRPFVATAIRDTLPYFLGSVDSDALQQRRELRLHRQTLRGAEERLHAATGRSDDLEQRERSMLAQAHDVGLIAIPQSQPAVEEIRPLLAGLLEQPPEDVIEPLTAEPERAVELDDRRRDAVERLNQTRAERRRLVDRRRLASHYAHEVVEHRARLLSLEIMPEASESNEVACPLCGISASDAGPAAAELRAELEQARTQAENSRASEPRLDTAIAGLDEQVATLRGVLSEIDAELRAVVARSEVAQQARSQRELQAFVRGRIAAFLEEHPVRDVGEVQEATDQVTALRARVKQLERALSAETTRLRTEKTLGEVGVAMTQMARKLGLGYTQDGVRLDPVVLTVVAGEAENPLWLNEDIGSGKNWVGYHLVTVLALHAHFAKRNRPVPRMLMLDQPTQAFYPSERRRAADRSVTELPDEDQELVRRQFALLRDTVAALDGKVQVIVTDHADIAEDWFLPAVRHEWRDGRALVPRDWYD